MVSSRDVARLAKVSQSTVSRAYREDVYIDPNTRKRVFDAARQLGYYPNLSARSLRNQQSQIIGLMLSDPNNAFFASLTQHIERCVTQRGYRLLLTYNEENAEKERFCTESLISSRAEGILAMPVSKQNEDMYQIMRNNGIGTVQLIRQTYDNLNTVMVNDELGAYIATKYLLEQGHRRIILTEYSFNQELPAKILGYRRACEEFGIDPEPGILNLPFTMGLDGFIAGAIARYRATAIISANLPITLATLKACESCGLKIPEDLSIVAYDDSEWLEFLKITTITHPMQQIGDSMVDVLFRDIEAFRKGEQPEPETVSIQPYLLLRQSVKII
jgi:DNA-binding LacI/PurR family transcriptional regulator